MSNGIVVPDDDLITCTTIVLSVICTSSVSFPFSFYSRLNLRKFVWNISEFFCGGSFRETTPESSSEIFRKYV